MDPEFWRQRWLDGQIGFHQEQPTPLLLKHWAALRVSPGTRVFVPLAGKTLDMVWFAAQGYRVLGVELSPLAVEQFFAEQSLTPEIRQSRYGTHYSAGNIELVCGVPAVFEWAETHLDVDYYMCCYYNPTPRTDDPEHVHGAVEEYREQDRRAMTELIQTLSRPVIHYKILAAGRNDPAQAFAYCGARMRPQDLACVGVFTGDDPRMLETDVRLFEQHSRAQRDARAPVAAAVR